MRRFAVNCAPNTLRSPENFLNTTSQVFASDFDLIVRAMPMISSSSMFPECLMFFSFLRSRGGSGCLDKIGIHSYMTVTIKMLTLESLDDQRRGRRDDGDRCLSILDCELDRYP
jgi:hypothetical protein